MIQLKRNSSIFDLSSLFIERNNIVNSDENDDSTSSSKLWKDNDPDELRRYCLSNLDKTDCSFLLMDSEEVVGSFRWMLCDISPKLKEILSQEENQAKGCKEIPIPDEYFKNILSYAYTKKLQVSSAENFLVNLYEVARKYEVKDLAEMIMYETEDETGRHNNNWIYLFKKAKMEYPSDDGWQEFFENVMWNMTLRAKNWYLEKRIQTILTFDEFTFDEFYDYIIQAGLKPIHCFHAAELYLKKRLFNGNSPKPFGDEMQKSIVKSYMDKISFDKMSFEEHANVFYKSSLLKKIYCD